MCQYYVTNAARATSLGAEFEMQAAVVDHLQLLTASLGYSQVEFEEFKDVNRDYQRNKCPFAPDNTFNLGARYRHLPGLYVDADMTGYSEMYFDQANKYTKDTL